MFENKGPSGFARAMLFLEGGLPRPGRNLGGFWGLGWSGGGRLEGENYRFDIGASKLFNNSTTFQP